MIYKRRLAEVTVTPCRLCSCSGFVNFEKQNRELQYARLSEGASRYRKMYLSSEGHKARLSPVKK
jgi:hypothetical protein